MFQKYGQHDQSFIADSVADLADLPKVNMGSTCYVIATAEKYMINSKGEWVLQMSYRKQNQGGGGTGEDVDLSDYATIDYSDAEDAKLKKYVDERDVSTLEATDEYIANMIEEGNSNLISALENHTTEIIKNSETGSTWGSIA